MRSALLKAILVFSFCAAAHAQVNPHTQIRWPTNCASDPKMAYNWQNNTCVLAGPVGNSGEVQINQGGAWYSLPGFNYNFATDTLSIPNLAVSGTSAITIPPTQMVWPSGCNANNFTSYNAASNACFDVRSNVTAGTTTTLPAGSPATVTQTGSFPNFVLNFGIPAGPTGGSLSYPGVVTDGSNGMNVTGGVQSASVTSTAIAATTVAASVNKVLLVTAPPYNAKCDLKPANNVTITSNVTSGFTFTSADVGKVYSGLSSIANGAIPYTGTVASVTGGNATLTPANGSIPTTVSILFGYLGTNDQTAIQQAFTDARTNSQSIQFPAGSCLTGTITYYGQSFFGASNTLSIIQGMPGKDVFQYPDGGTGNGQAYVHDIRVVVDLSIDVSATPGVNSYGFPVFSNRIAGTYQGATALTPAIQPGPMLIGPAACGGGARGTGGSTAVAIFCNAVTNNLSIINPNRVVGAPITIYGAGTSIPVTNWSITGNVATFQATNTLNAGDIVTLQSFSAAYMNTTQYYSVLAAGLSGSQFSVNFIHANVASTPETTAYAGTTYNGTIATVGTFTGGNLQNLTVSPALTTTVTDMQGYMLNPVTPPWYPGNAAFAMPCINGNNCTSVTSEWKFQNVYIIGTGSGYMQFNHSTGFYLQEPLYTGIMENVNVYALWGGYIEAAPNTGRFLTPDTWTAKDLNLWNCVVPFVTYNGNDRLMNGVNIYASGGVQSMGPFFLAGLQGGTSTSITGGLNNYRWVIHSLYVEGSAPYSGEFARFQTPARVTSGNMSSGNGYVSFPSSGGLYDGSVGSILHISGSYNTFVNAAVKKDFEVQDTGEHNLVEVGYYPVNSYYGRKINGSVYRSVRDPIGKQRGDFLSAGSSQNPYANQDDLFWTCEDWGDVWNPSSFSGGVNRSGQCLTDTTPSEYVHFFFRSALPNLRLDLTQSGVAASNMWTSVPKTFGTNTIALPSSTSAGGNSYVLPSVMVPMVKSTIYIRARCVGTTACSAPNALVYDINPVTNALRSLGPGVTLNFTNTWTTQSFVADLSTATVGDIAMPYTNSWTNTGVGTMTNWDMEWWTIVPQRTDSLTAPSWSPGTLYSAAGTALPTCVTALKGMRAVVSDATLTSGTYASGGANTVPVICSGSSWLIEATGTVTAGGVADVDVTVPVLTSIPSNTCWGSTGSTTPATFTMSGVTTAMGIRPMDTGNPSAIAGWGATGGLTIRPWASGANTGSYIVCNTSGSTITSGSIVIRMGAQ